MTAFVIVVLGVVLVFLLLRLIALEGRVQRIERRP